MKTVIANLDESKVLSLIKILPKEKIKISDEIYDSHIPYVDDVEQEEIEEKLKNPDTKIITKRKTFDL